MAIGEDGEVETEVTVTADIKLPEINGKTATSEILKLTAEGGLLSVHRFVREVATSIAWDGEGLLVGTGFEGEVWRFVNGGGARIATIDAVQVVGVVDGGAVLLTQGPGGVLWRRMEGDRAGRFRSKAQQFKQPVRFGEYRVEPASDDLRIRFRSGISAKPDTTWLALDRMDAGFRRIGRFAGSTFVAVGSGLHGQSKDGASGRQGRGGGDRGQPPAPDQAAGGRGTRGRVSCRPAADRAGDRGGPP